VSKTLDKISKLLNQAENAGTPEEAATFMAKVQEMATVNNVDLAVARLHQAKKERVQEPEERTIVANPYSRKHNRKHYLDLLMKIADVNDVKYLIGGKERCIFAVGFPSDLDVVEALFAHLSIQMVTECDEALKRGDNKEVRQVPVEIKIPIPFDDRDWEGWDSERDRYYDPHPSEISYWDTWDEERYEQAIKNGERISTGRDQWGNTQDRKPVPPPKYRIEHEKDEEGNTVFVEKRISIVDGRVFRNDFYLAFVMRMGSRLWEARRMAEAASGVSAEDKTSEVALALVDKKETLKDAHQKQRDAVTHWASKPYEGAYADEHRKSDYSGVGREKGAQAADSTAIDERGRGVRK
jgi:hypothetical protein